MHFCTFSGRPRVQNKKGVIMRFKRVYIEVTNVCNLNCEFCMQHNRVNKFMSFEEFKIILDEIKPFTKYIFLHVKGEPLLHPEIDNFIKYAFSEGFEINLTTNATLLKEHLNITKYLRQINISLHATNDIEIVKVAKLINNCIINFRVWNFEENKEAITLLENEFNIAIKDVTNFKIKDNIFVSAQNRFKWPDISSKTNLEHGYCHALKDQIAILVDGTVVPCCLDNNGDIPLGNIFDKTFDEIISSEKVTNIINGFQNRVCVEELCKKCEFKTRF